MNSKIILIILLILLSGCTQILSETNNFEDLNENNEELSSSKETEPIDAIEEGMPEEEIEMPKNTNLVKKPVLVSKDLYLESIKYDWYALNLTIEYYFTNNSKESQFIQLNETWTNAKYGEKLDFPKEIEIPGNFKNERAAASTIKNSDITKPVKITIKGSLKELNYEIKNNWILNG